MSEIRVADVSAARQASSALIEERGVLAGNIGLQQLLNELFADRQIEGVHIQLETIDAENIKVGTLTADLINVASLNGWEITGVVINGIVINGGVINGAIVNAGNIQIANSVISFGGTTLTLTSQGLTVGGTFHTNSSASVSGTFTSAGLLSALGNAQVLFDLTVGGTITESSMRAGKADLRKVKIEDALAILDLPAYNYRKRGDKSAPRRVGWIAEDAADGPLAVLAGRDGGELKGIQYSRATVLHNVILADQRATIARQQAAIDDLLARVSALESQAARSAS